MGRVSGQRGRKGRKFFLSYFFAFLAGGAAPVAPLRLVALACGGDNGSPAAWTYLKCVWAWLRIWTDVRVVMRSAAFVQLWP